MIQPGVRPKIILQAEPENETVSYTLGHKGDKMIVIISLLMFVYILGSISPLLITDDMQDIVMLEHA
jgi:hypothetical protein